MIVDGYISWSDKRAITELLLGKSIVKAEDDTLTLSDGTELLILPNEGGCSCGGGGDYTLERLNTFPNIITNAEVLAGDEAAYQLFVYSEGLSQSVADVSGDDGSGYYGTGFTIHVKRSEEREEA